LSPAGLVLSSMQNLWVCYEKKLYGSIYKGTVWFLYGDEAAAVKPNSSPAKPKDRIQE
jgi:hypothetical protein